MVAPSGAAAPTEEWLRRFTSPDEDGARAVSADGLGNVYIAGDTYIDSAVTGINSTKYDGFVAKYDEAGALQWSTRFGSPLEDHANGISADHLGNVFVVGTAGGGLEGRPLTGAVGTFS